MPLDRIDEFAMAALFAPHMHGDDGMERRHQPQNVKEHPKKEAWNDQRQIEDRGKGLAVEQQPQRRNKNCKEIDHGRHALPEYPTVNVVSAAPGATRMASRRSAARSSNMAAPRTGKIRHGCYDRPC